MEQQPLYGIWSYYGGWNLLYQYPRTRYYNEAEAILQKARQNSPRARLKIDVVPED